MSAMTVFMEIFRATIQLLVKYIFSKIRFARRWLRERFWKSRWQKPTPIILGYLETFLNTGRCVLDEDLCAAGRIRTSKLCFVARDSSSPPALTFHLDKLQQLTVGSVATIPQFLERICDTIAGVYGDPKNVLVLLGEPGSGKSVVAVQSATLMATLAKDGKAPIPVYVNLSEFVGEPTLQQMEALVAAAIESACPRYLTRDTTPTVAGKRFLEEVNALEAGGSVFYILDGIDEMPIDKYSQRVQAIADFIAARRNLGFLVTCRYRDFVLLGKESGLLKMQRFDLLLWSKRLAQEYVRTILPGESRAQHRAVMATLQRHAEQFDGRYHPLVVALVCKTFDSTLDHRLSGLWKHYVTQQVKRHAGDPNTVQRVLDALSRQAYSQTWPKISKYDISPDLEAIAHRAALIRRVASGVVFTIRPLQHYFAGSELITRVRARQRLPKSITLEDLNHREAFCSASEQAGPDAIWMRVLIRALARPGRPRDYADRLSFIVDTLTPEQVQTSRTVLRLVSRITEYIVTEGDDVDRERCLDAVIKRPELLEPKQKQLPYFFSGITLFGSASALNWLVTFLATNKRMWSKHWRFLVAAVRRSADERLIRTQVLLIQAALFRRTPRPVQRAIHIACSALLGVALVAGQYFLYCVGASFGLGMLVLLRLPAASEVQFFFTDALLYGLRNALPLLPQEGVGTLLILYPARYFINEQARAGLRFQRAFTRSLTLILVVSAAMLFGACGELILARLWLLGYLVNAVVIAEVVWLLGSLAWLIATNADWKVVLRSRWARLHTKLFNGMNWGPVAATSAVHAAGATDVGGRQHTAARAASAPIINPSDLLALAEQALLRSGQAVRVEKSTRHFRISGVCALSSVAVMALILGGLDAFLGVALLLVLSVLGYVFLIDPLVEYSRVKEYVKCLVRSALAFDSMRALNLVISHIGTSNPEWMNAWYARMLDEVPFNEATFARLEEFYKRLPPGKTKTQLTRIVSRAYHEVMKNRS